MPAQVGSGAQVTVPGQVVQPGQVTTFQQVGSNWQVGTPPQVMIGLQHTDGQIVRIGTAAGEAAERVPELIATVTGKPASIL